MDEYVAAILVKTTVVMEIPQCFRIRPPVKFLTPKMNIAKLPDYILDKYFTPENFVWHGIPPTAMICNIIHLNNPFMLKLFIERFAGNHSTYFVFSYRVPGEFASGYVKYNGNHIYQLINDKIFENHFTLSSDNSIYFLDLKMHSGELPN